MIFCVLSLGIAALCNPTRVVRQIWPYITVVVSFGAFVAWNGGVVLGMLPIIVILTVTNKE
jgi:alpha-1,2-glucosyltransferase